MTYSTKVKEILINSNDPFRPLTAQEQHTAFVTLVLSQGDSLNYKITQNQENKEYDDYNGIEISSIVSHASYDLEYIKQEAKATRLAKAESEIEWLLNTLGVAIFSQLSPKQWQVNFELRMGQVNLLEWYANQDESLAKIEKAIQGIEAKVIDYLVEYTLKDHFHGQTEKVTYLVNTEHNPAYRPYFFQYLFSAANPQLGLSWMSSEEYDGYSNAALGIKLYSNAELAFTEQKEGIKISRKITYRHDLLDPTLIVG